MERRVMGSASLRGRVMPPGDKSISHRAVIFNSLAQGEATVRNFLWGADCRATVACLRALGGRVQVQHGEEEHTGSTLRVRGVGGSGLQEPEDVLDAKNSGTTLRLLTGLLAAQPFLSTLTGDASLRSRPMGRIIQPLRLMGAQIGGRKNDTLAPLVIKGGNLRGVEYRLPVASAQLKSALILAALHAQGSTTLQEPAASRDHTELMLRAMGAAIESSEGTIRVQPLSQPLRGMDVFVPGDISSAAFWLVAGAAHPEARLEVCGVGLNPTRTGLLQVLRRMGAHLLVQNERLEGGEPVADVVVESSSLVGTEVCGEEIPLLIDEIPVLAVAACFARGETVIRDAAELRVKETDRIATTAQELTKLGAHIRELPDGLVIRGGSRLQGASCTSHGDHRLAMSLGIAGLLAQGETVVHNAEVVEVSYPGYWQALERLSRTDGI